MSSYSAIVQKTIEEAKSKLHKLSDYLFANPEICRQEVKAHAAITDLLESEGFQVKRHAHSETGFIASFTSSPTASSPHVAFMCEYDALPDIGHACGHNLIAESAVGAGLAVKQVMLELGIQGRITVLGTPAEENDSGKVDFIKAGFFTDVDAALMAHPTGGSENMLINFINARSDFHVDFKGRSSHAASIPWEAVNALDAAFQAYQNVSNLRQHIPPSYRVAGVITNGGTVPNIIPDQTHMIFTLRAPDTNELSRLKQRWRLCMEAAAIATGCEVKISPPQIDTTELINNICLADTYEKHAKTLGITFKRHHFVAGSTDMGNVSKEVPAIHPEYQIASKFNVHEADFAGDTRSDEALTAVLQQAQILAMTALDVMTDDELRTKMKEEFRKSTSCS